MKPTSSSTTNTNPTILSPQIISTKSVVSNSNNKNTATTDDDEEQPLEHLIRGNNSDSTESRCESIATDDDDDDSSLILHSDSTTEAWRRTNERRERVEEENQQQQLQQREMPTIETTEGASTTTEGPLLSSPDTPKFAAFMDFITSGGRSEDDNEITEVQQQQGVMSPTTNDNIHTNAMEDMSLQATKSTQHPSSQHTSYYYDPTLYKYHNRYSTLSSSLSNYTSQHNTRTKIGKRCYRLNLERPFDIHCEQSPLVSFYILCFSNFDCV